MNDIVTVISAMHAKGIRIWREGGKLNYRRAGGTVTSEDIETLRARKAEILDFLDTSLATATKDPPIIPRTPSEPIPLTFSQQTYWKGISHFRMKHNTRSCANANRLSGALNVDSLKAAFTELVKRHEILRAQIVPGETEVTQVIIEDRKLDLEVVNIGEISATDRESEAQQLVEEMVNQPCDMTVDPLFAARLVRIGDEDHVLIVTVDHIIADALSVGILLRDVWTIYLRAIRGLPLPLPKIPLQFTDYALWEQRMNAEWVAEHGRYWRERLAGATRTRISLAGPPTPGVRLKFDETPLRFSKELTEGLRNLAQREHTTLVMTVLTAYVALLSRWSKTTDVTLAFPLAGRSRPEFDNTIGFFAFALFLRFEVFAGDSFKDLLHRVTREYYSALKHQDFGRNALAWPESEYTRTVGFNWFSRMRANGRSTEDIYGGEPAVKEGAIRLKSYPFKRAAFDLEWDNDRNDHIDYMDGEPGLWLSESADGISGRMWYRVESVPTPTMEMFSRSFRLIAEAARKDPQIRLVDLPCERESPIAPPLSAV